MGFFELFWDGGGGGGGFQKVSSSIPRSGISVEVTSQFFITICVYCCVHNFPHQLVVQWCALCSFVRCGTPNQIEKKNNFFLNGSNINVPYLASLLFNFSTVYYIILCVFQS